MNTTGLKSSIIYIENLPEMYPTHRHSPQFWEQLGRTVATYGCLEEVLARAIFAFTAKREYTDKEFEQAFLAWRKRLEWAVTASLSNLADNYGKAVRDNTTARTENISDLIEEIKEGAELRNVLCHGSWWLPNEYGASVPWYVNKKKDKFETEIDFAFLQQVQTNTAKLICSVMDSVTVMGFQFPGKKGIGRPVF